MKRKKGKKFLRKAENTFFRSCVCGETWIKAMRSSADVKCGSWPEAGEAFKVHLTVGCFIMSLKGSCLIKYELNLRVRLTGIFLAVLKIPAPVQRSRKNHSRFTQREGKTNKLLTQQIIWIIFLSFLVLCHVASYIRWKRDKHKTILIYCSLVNSPFLWSSLEKP